MKNSSVIKFTIYLYSFLIPWNWVLYTWAFVDAINCEDHIIHHAIDIVFALVSLLIMCPITYNYFKYVTICVKGLKELKNAVDDFHHYLIYMKMRGQSHHHMWQMIYHFCAISFFQIMYLISK